MTLRTSLTRGRNREAILAKVQAPTRHQPRRTMPPLAGPSFGISKKVRPAPAPTTLVFTDPFASKDYDSLAPFRTRSS